MTTRILYYSHLSILIVLILTIFSCTTGINSKKRINLEETLPIITDQLDTSQSKLMFDTILINVMDEIVSLAPITDIEGQSIKEIPLDLPLKSDNFQYGSYWIGVGYSNFRKYELLNQTIPAEWSKPGVSVPLGAYSLGKSVTLPESSSENVIFMIGTKQETSKVMQQNNGVIPMHLRISSFQKRFDLPVTEKEKLYLLVSNQHRANANKIDIKFIATQIIKHRE